jgi:hypothetical protein
VSNNKLPPEVVDHWPEVFNDIEIKAVPIEYLKAIFVHFVDGKVWEITIDQNKVREGNARHLEDAIEDLLEEYEDVIDGIDFRLDTEKVKQDISKRTKVFLKKRK